MTQFKVQVDKEKMTLDIFKDMQDEDKELSLFTDVKKIPFQMIGTAIIDMREYDPDVDMRGCEVLHYDHIPLCADLNTEGYFEDVMSMVVADEFDQLIDYDNLEEHDVIPGVYRYVFTVQIDSLEYIRWEDYDEWYYVTLLSKHRYNSADLEFVLDTFAENIEPDLHHYFT